MLQRALPAKSYDTKVRDEADRLWKAAGRSPMVEGETMQQELQAKRRANLAQLEKELAAAKATKAAAEAGGGRAVDIKNQEALIALRQRDVDAAQMQVEAAKAQAVNAEKARAAWEKMGQTLQSSRQRLLDVIAAEQKRIQQLKDEAKIAQLRRHIAKDILFTDVKNPREEQAGWQERRGEARKARRQWAADERREQKLETLLENRGGRGLAITKGSREWLEDRHAWKRAEAHAKKHERDIARREERMAQNSDDTVKELRGIRADLVKNLQAAGEG
jgi:hypothetical protein